MRSLVTGLARWLAYSGGVALFLLIAMTVVSVIGRSLAIIGLGPVPGDLELMQAGIAYAVFAFLPWCQLEGGHARVDIFTSLLSSRANRVIDLAWDLVLGGTTVLIGWRLGLGMIDKIGNGETSFMLQFPIWWAYAAVLPALGIGIAVAVSVVVLRLRDMISGPAGAGA